MADFAGLPLATLRSISAAAGDDYEDVTEGPLRVQLAERGFSPSPEQLNGTLWALAQDGYIQATFNDFAFAWASLDTLGRQTVEGWPTSPISISSGEVNQLVRELERRGDDPTLTPDERSKAKAAAAAVGNLGLSVAGGLLVGWLKSIGVA